MLSLAQRQIIIAQNIRNVVTTNQTYSPSKTFERMGIANSDTFDIFIENIFDNKFIGLPFYNHKLPADAFDTLDQTSKLSEAEEILRTATKVSSNLKNPVF